MLSIALSLNVKAFGGFFVYLSSTTRFCNVNKISLFVNDQLAFEYDRETVLEDEQLAFLEKMDAGMAQGIRVYGELITRPDVKQKASFVVMNLLRALRQDDQARIAVSSAYLATRLPHVVEVHARDQGDRVNIEFIEEH